MGRNGTEGTVVYLARHGQTELNELDVLRGLLDPPLDQVGRRQAARLGLALTPRNPTSVVASPLTRAVQTALPTAEALGIEVETDQHFLDRDYGPWTGHLRQEVLAQWGSVEDAPGVEARDALGRRAMDGMTALAQQHPGATIMVVSHDAVNRELLVRIDPGLGQPDEVPQDNGCFNTLVWQDSTWTVRGVNELPP